MSKSDQVYSSKKGELERAGRVEASTLISCFKEEPQIRFSHKVSYLTKDDTQV